MGLNPMTAMGIWYGVLWGASTDWMEPWFKTDTKKKEKK